MQQTEIQIEKARSHNLKGFDCRIPLTSLTVITGVSGSGKSSLAFDTLYAEGQRRYVTSLSTYARQFLERLPRPDVDSISSLPPAIAIEQRNRVTNARSTVGTATEILDSLRLLFSKVGVTRCPDCDVVVQKGEVLEVANRIATRFAGERVQLGVPLVRSSNEEVTTFRDRLASEGFTRMIDSDGSLVDWVEVEDERLSDLAKCGLLLIDRFVLPDGASVESLPGNLRLRLTEAVALAFARGGGVLYAQIHGEDSKARVAYRKGLICDRCGRRFPDPEPNRLSFNSPLGACPSCQGFGRQADIDWNRVFPDPQLALDQHVIAPFATRMGRSMERDLLAACRQANVPTDVPFADLSEEQKEWVREGDDASWYGVRGFFQWLEKRRYKVQARVSIARYRRYDRCEDCDGSRLCSDARAVEVGGYDLGRLSSLDIAALSGWLNGLEFSHAEQLRAGRLLEMLRTRLGTVLAVGLGYLGLDRLMRTLSGGEAQRVQLATALGGGLTSSLYVLDEPSIGLHARDLARLVEVLRAIRDQGNTVVVVEHAEEVLRAADHVIDLGPGAGRFGGELLVEGPLERIRAHPDSQTGRLLRGEFARRNPAGKGSLSDPHGVVRIVGAGEHNLQNVTVDIPLGRLVAVTGVSGAGKSTLVQRVLVGHLAPGSTAGETPGLCERIEGTEQVERVVMVDQTPAVRSPRSNVATVSKAFEGIRKLFAATREARALGVSPGWFSFNVAGGRCDACEGAGNVVIDMQFLDDVQVPCDECGGLRYRREVLGIKLDGRSIVDVLALTLEEAAEVFAAERKIVSRLDPFLRVGLGYLTMGQPLSTFSGGEHQRVRLALAMSEKKSRALYILDEPTTGLHASDVQILLGCLDELVDLGGSVVVVEHNLDVIQHADWVIDVGPEAGPLGGQIVFAGASEALALCPESHTGRALAARERERAYSGG